MTCYHTAEELSTIAHAAIRYVTRCEIYDRLKSVVAEAERNMAYDEMVATMEVVRLQ